MSRFDDNAKILKRLTYMVEKFPHLRFGQILCNMAVLPSENLTGVNAAEYISALFYEESDETAERVEGMYKQLKT